VQVDGIGVAGPRDMDDGVPGPDLEHQVILCLDVLQPMWLCRPCIARTVDVSVREVKIALLRLARSRGRNYTETGCAVCEGCAVRTAVVRLARHHRLRLVA
jgi:hypothetical protein